MRAVLQSLDTEPDPSYVARIPRGVSALPRMIIGPADHRGGGKPTFPKVSIDLDAEAWKQSWPECRIETGAFVEKVSGSRPGCP
jgi:hypothetical protein